MVSEGEGLQDCPTYGRAGGMDIKSCQLQFGAGKYCDAPSLIDACDMYYLCA